MVGKGARSARWGLAAALLVAGSAARADPPAPHAVEVGKVRLLVAFPDWPDMAAPGFLDEQLRGYWTGTVGSSHVAVVLRLFPHGKYRLTEPEKVTAFALHTQQDPEQKGDPDFRFTTAEKVQGPFGYVPWGHLCAGPLPNAERPEGELILLGGVLPEHSYVLMLEARPALEPAARAQAMDLLRTGVRAESPVRDPRWTEEEVQARLAVWVSEEKARKRWKTPVRTKHYIVFTDSGAGKLFADKMEEFYAKIQATYPFPESPEARLMPVILFRAKSGYEVFCTWVLKSPGLGERSKGHAYEDYYATYYDSPNDPVHVHEATHQIFFNRLGLDGGGSWFQEGVAEYMSTLPGERKTYAKKAAQQTSQIPFAKFVRIPDLLSEPGVDGPKAYLQAASLIEFLREGSWKPERFPDFLRAMGAVERSHLAGVERVVREVYDTDLAGLEAEWVKYWARRP